MLKYLTITLILWLLPTSAALADESPYMQLIGQADKQIKKGNWAEAEQLYREAIRTEPENPQNVLLTANIGMLQYYDDRAQEAIATLTRAHEQAPVSVTILMNRAKVYTALDMTDEAIADYRRVCRLDTLLADPHYYLALLAIEQADTTEALRQADTLASLQPDSYYNHMARSTILLSSGKIMEALPHLTKVIELDPDAANYGRRALCYLIQGDLGAAADDIAAGLVIDPTSGELYLYRAMLNKMRFRPDDARSDAEKAVRYGVAAAHVKSLLE